MLFFIGNNTLFWLKIRFLHNIYVIDSAYEMDFSRDFLLCFYYDVR
jgi:hypothetical protein